MIHAALRFRLTFDYLCNGLRSTCPLFLLFTSEPLFCMSPSLAAWLLGRFLFIEHALMNSPLSVMTVRFTMRRGDESVVGMPDCGQQRINFRRPQEM